MNANEYQKSAVATAACDHDTIRKRLCGDSSDIDLLHAAMGICTEAGEFIDPIKKTVFYGKPLDVVNLKEELGDMLWYIALAAEAMGTTIGEVMSTNISKLEARYGGKFTESAAVIRDLAVEREILEE